MTRIGQTLLAIVSLGVTDECSDNERTTRRVFTSASLFLGVASPIWGAMYAIFGEPWSGAIPSVYAAITLASFVALHRWGGWHWFRVSQLVLIFVLPVALMLSLGGFIPGSAVVL